MEMPMRLSVSPIAVISAALIAFVTVLISTWIPSKRATKINPIEAIRQTNDISVKAKKVKTSKLTYKIFGLSGVLANKHYKRSRKRYRATIVSLFMSIVLFVSASSFSGYLTSSVESSFSTNKYDISYYATADALRQHSNEEIYSMLKNAKGIEKAVYLSNVYRGIIIAKSDLSKSFLKLCSDKGYVVGNEYFLDVDLNFVDDEVYRQYLNDIGLDEDVYFNNDSPQALMFDVNTYFDSEQEKFISLDIISDLPMSVKMSDFKYIEGYYCDGNVFIKDDDIKYVSYTNIETRASEDFLYDEVKLEDKTLNINQKITEIPFFIDTYSSVTLVYPYSMREVIMGNDYEFPNVTYYMTSSNHTESTAEINKVLIENGLETAHLRDYAEIIQQNRNVVLIINVFAYGFIALISLIAAANVFNTISTNIALRRREFAMLKSVGMTKRGFNKMMNFECILYGTRALLFGIPVSIGITYLIFMAVNEGFETTFIIPWLAIGIAVLSVFLVVFATMMYSMGKIKKDNPIDALKNENI